TVSIFPRRLRLFSRNAYKYGPRPATIIRDPLLCHPHSVAFTPETNHLVVTNAGANYFSVYPAVGAGSKTRWSQSPALRQMIGPDSVFQKVNANNEMEGGPKGVAVHQASVAVCIAERGIKIYSFREGLSTLESRVRAAPCGAAPCPEASADQLCQQNS